MFLWKYVIVLVWFDWFIHHPVYIQYTNDCYVTSDGTEQGHPLLLVPSEGPISSSRQNFITLFGAQHLYKWLIAMAMANWVTSSII